MHSTSSHFKLPVLLFFALLLVCSASFGKNVPSSVTTVRNETTCLSRFRREPEHFAQCKTNICFIFQNEPPYIELDRSMKTEQHQELFNCSNLPRHKFQGLRGSAFQIHRDMNTDALCVWAGAGCSFNGMVDFIRKRAQDNATADYRFGITGLLVQMPSRVSIYTLPSVSMLESEVVVLGPSNLHKGPIQRSFHQIFRAFQLNTWLVLGTIVLFFVVVALCIAAVFSTPCNIFNILMNLFGEHVQYERSHRLLQMQNTRTFLWANRLDPKRFQNLRLLHRMAITVLRIALSAFTIISLLFFEISIVNFIFNKKFPQLGTEISDLSDDELRKYSITKATAAEHVWIKTVDPSRTRFKDGKYPWYRSSGSHESYRKLLNSSDPTQFVVGFGAQMNYLLKQIDACETVTKYETSTPLSSFGGGWYLSKSVPEEARAEIDRELLELKLMGKMRTTFEGAGTSFAENCGQKDLNIGPEVIAIPLLFIVGPCIVVLMFFLFWGCFLRARMARRRCRVILKTETLTYPEEPFVRPFWHDPNFICRQ